MSLNPRQLAFVRAYAETGNATEAARRAGYAGDDATLGVTGHRLLKNDKVGAELAKHAKKAEKASIASVEECFELWSTLMRDEDLEPRDRLKASELRAKAAGVFIEKREVSGPGGGPQQHVVRDAVDGLEGDKLKDAARALLTKEKP
jgi:phage terminase small subunit